MASERDSVAEFERLKGEVEDLRVKRLAAVREQERLEGELAEIRNEIKEAYGVELEDFDSAITELEATYAKECAELAAAIDDCKQKLAEADK